MPTFRRKQDIPSLDPTEGQVASSGQEGGLPPLMPRRGRTPIKPTERMSTQEEMEGALAARFEGPTSGQIDLPQEATGGTGLVPYEERGVAPYAQGGETELAPYAGMGVMPYQESVPQEAADEMRSKLASLWGRLLQYKGPKEKDLHRLLDEADSAVIQGALNEAEKLIAIAGKMMDEAESQAAKAGEGIEKEAELERAALRQELHALEEEARILGKDKDPSVSSAFQNIESALGRGEDPSSIDRMINEARERLVPPPPGSHPPPPYEKVPSEGAEPRREREYAEMKWPYGPEGEGVGVPKEVRPEKPCAFCDQTAQYEGVVKSEYVGIPVRGGGTVVAGQFYPMCERHFQQLGAGLGPGRGQKIQPEVVPAGLTSKQEQRITKGHEEYTERYSKLAVEAGRFGIPTFKKSRIWDSGTGKWTEVTVPKTAEELDNQIQQFKIAKGEASLKQMHQVREGVGYYATGGPYKVPLQMGGRAVEWLSGSGRNVKPGLRPAPDRQLKGFYGSVGRDSLVLGMRMNMPRPSPMAWTVGVGMRQPSPGVLGPTPIAPSMPGVLPGPPTGMPAEGFRGGTPTATPLYRGIAPPTGPSIEVSPGPPVMSTGRSRLRVFNQNETPRVYRQPEMRNFS